MAGMTSFSSTRLMLRGLLLGLRPFDGLYGQDAFAYYNYALELRTSLLENGTIPAFFWPIGFPLHLVFAFSVLGVSPQAAQWVNVIAGALVAPLTFALTREVLIERDGPHARSAALVAGLSVAVGGGAEKTTIDKPKKLLTVAGVIGNVRYSNPHIFFDITAKNGTTWTVETEGILVARSKGLTEQVLKDGATATLSGWVSREKSAELGLKSITIGGRSISMRGTAR